MTGVLAKVIKQFKQSLESRWSPRWGIMRHFWVRVYFAIVVTLVVLVNFHLLFKWALGHEVDERVALNCSILSRLPNMGNIREEKGHNKQVYRVQLYDRRMIVKEASKAKWVTDQAWREIKFGMELDIDGIPKLLLKCPLKNHDGVRYAMELVDGVAVCADFYGTDHECRMLAGLKRRLMTNEERYERNMWTFIVSFITLLEQLADRGLWVEDMSGSNFVTDHKYSVHLVDLDSLQSINNQTVKCGDTCPPIINGRLWRPNSLNHKVSWNCPELANKCLDGHCSSNARLAECVFGRWILTALSANLPEMESADSLIYLRQCSTRIIPGDRCELSLMRLIATQALAEL